VGASQTFICLVRASQKTTSTNDGAMARVLLARANARHLASNRLMLSTTGRLVFALAIGLAGCAATQDHDVPRDAIIRLQRTSCLGYCPIYTVTIDARGTVTYDGERLVRVVGRRTAQIDPSAVATLLARAERIRFFQMRDAYREIENPDGTRESPSDQPTKIVTITVNGRTKRVEDYVGAPDAIDEFEREIDEAAGTKRWVFLDDEALEELLRAGWSASSEEGAALLHEAIRRDDLRIARRLIELGSDLDGPPTNRLPSLLLARSSQMVRLLVKAGANPNERPIGRVPTRTPLMTTAYKDAAVAEALLKAGALPGDSDEEGRTALWYAACAANRRVVAVLLGAGANPRAPKGMSPLECARQARRDEARRRRTVLDRGLPTVEDFDQVIALLESADKRIRR
jgi:ankyrin repeat protein